MGGALPARIARAIDRFVERAAAAPAGDVREILLFGSYARGDFRGDSDVDLLAVVERREPALLDWLYDAVLEVQLHDRVDLSLKVLQRNAMEEMTAAGDPFAEALRREARLLWTKSAAEASASA
jgi:predicted nucleotidyltransferase